MSAYCAIDRSDLQSALRHVIFPTVIAALSALAISIATIIKSGTVTWEAVQAALLLFVTTLGVDLLKALGAGLMRLADRYRLNIPTTPPASNQ